MAPRKYSKVYPDNGSGFDVTVSSVIGHVDIGSGTENPNVVAFQIIGGYFNDQDSMGDYPGGEFRFPGGAMGETIVVNISKEMA